MEALWTIDELSERVAQALAVGYEAPENGQVRAVPNRRTIRYYTTLGLLSRPAAMNGRTALYDERHLTQLVAIKRLQSQGLALAAIQERLAGADLTEISSIAELPEPAVAAPPESARASFWLEPPATAPEPAPAPSPPPASTPTPAPTLSPTTPTHQGFELAPGVVLMLETREHANPRALDLTALRAAAAPLLAALRIASPDRPA